MKMAVDKESERNESKLSTNVGGRGSTYSLDQEEKTVRNTMRKKTKSAMPKEVPIYTIYRRFVAMNPQMDSL
jgi:hypothetical protein